jgi:hypothetical protein
MTRDEYNEARLVLLEQFVERVGSICFSYMPPDGQDAMQAQQDAYRGAVLSLGAPPDGEA